MGIKFFKGDAEARSEQQVTAALGRSMARIEFDTDGNILRANENFEKVMGYKVADIIGKHHSMFVPKKSLILTSIVASGRSLPRANF